MAEPCEFFESLDETTVAFERVGVPTCVERGKHVIFNRGTWALVMFYAHVRGKGGTMRPRVMFHRYRKIGGGWRKFAALNMDPGQLIKAARIAARYLAEEPR